MSDAYTIRIFVPNGDPEGVRIVDRMNWTGLGIVFPRAEWLATKHRTEFDKTGVYILVGYAEGQEDTGDELPTIYVGQGDVIRNRIDAHFKNKDFWNWGIAFISTGGSGLNRAHSTWLEYALVEKAVAADRSHLDNGNVPQEPALSESEKADTQAFLQEILQILPLANLQAFEKPRAVINANAPSETTSIPGSREQIDTIIVPARQEGFERVFLGEDSWYAIRIAFAMLPKVKYIAAYQSQPVSAITHFAPVDHIEPYGEGGKYKLVFAEPATKIGPVPYGDARMGVMQGPRYTSIEKLKTAKQLSDLM